MTKPTVESVWDYPRPPRVEPSSELVEVVLGGRVVASTTSSWRCSRPATRRPLLSRAAFAAGTLRPAVGRSWCEWKGQASYVDLVAGETVAARAGWLYELPSPGFEMSPVRSR